FLADAQTQPAVRAAVGEALTALAGLGAELVDVALPHLEALRNRPQIGIPEAAYVHADWMASRPEGYAPDLMERLRTSAAASAADLVHSQRIQTAAIRSHDLLLKQYDALVGPTTPITAPPIEGLPTGAAAPPFGLFTSPFNATGLPALSVPCGFDGEGLP